MTTNITIKLTTDSNTPTFGDIANAVRRALTQANVKDQPANPDVPLATKGVTVKASLRAVKEKTVNPVRQWAVENGYPEYEGKRGRIAKPVLDLYAAATEGK